MDGHKGWACVSGDEVTRNKYTNNGKRKESVDSSCHSTLYLSFRPRSSPPVALFFTYAPTQKLLGVRKGEVLSTLPFRK